MFDYYQRNPVLLPTKINLIIFKGDYNTLIFNCCYTSTPIALTVKLFHFFTHVAYILCMIFNIHNGFINPLTPNDL
jgi:hypothetical protein